MNLKTLRELKGISRKELAEQTGLSYRSIQDYEQGHKDLGPRRRGPFCGWPRCWTARWRT